MSIWILWGPKIQWFECVFFAPKHPQQNGHIPQAPSLNAAAVEFVPPEEPAAEMLVMEAGLWHGISDRKEEDFWNFYGDFIRILLGFSGDFIGIFW